MLYRLPDGARPAAYIADALWPRVLEDPLTFARTRIYLPTRRACRSVREAFLRRSDGQATILPGLMAIGALDTDPFATAGSELMVGEVDGSRPPIDPMSRRLILARQVLAIPDLAATPAQALTLADALAGLLDEMIRYGVRWDRLEAIVPDHLSAQWARSLQILDVLRVTWPQLLTSLDLEEPESWRNAIIQQQTNEISAADRPYPVFAIGVLPDFPALSLFLQAIVRHVGESESSVVLPAFDPGAVTGNMKGGSYDELAALLTRLQCMPADLPIWGGTLVRQKELKTLYLMRKSIETPENKIVLTFEAAVQAPSALKFVESGDLSGEAQIISMILREVLETPGRTAALVTPDRELARRTRLALERWGIEIDDSAGAPLKTTAPAVFMQLMLDVMQQPQLVSPLLALLKHPLAGGDDRARWRAAARWLDRTVRQYAGITTKSDDLTGWLDALGVTGPQKTDEQDGTGRHTATIRLVDQSLADLTWQYRRRLVPFRALLASHIQAAEAIAGSDRLWRGEAGIALSDCLAQALDGADALGEIAPIDYPALFAGLLSPASVRPLRDRHPRLAIWGPLEARLQSADVLVLGGLVEGVWPPAPPVDPWLSRQMRLGVGLPPADAVIGRSAVDFLSLFGMGDVVLSCSRRREGQATLRSRWLRRLDVVLRASGVEQGLDACRDPVFEAMASRLDRPAAVQPCAEPRPSPPVPARPRRLAITQIERWLLNPYEIYARWILNLKALDPLDAAPDARLRGTVFHLVLERAMVALGARDPATAVATAAVHACIDGVLEQCQIPPAQAVFWRARLGRILDWWLDREAERRGIWQLAGSEAKGRLVLAAPGGAFEIVGKADRIDRHADGGYEVMDYKTGQIPSLAQIKGMLKPQLLLEAAMLARGTIEGIPPGRTQQISYWRITGGSPAGEGLALDADIEGLSAQMLARLEDWIAGFDVPDQPYLVYPADRRAPPADDYSHLSRIAEWASGDGDGE